ncbi:MAG TPA: tellurite resistance TerB family protein [Rhizomicrobium sp.]|jgi:tellurite resistance protein|nr:tellurite resistance TerB family protein [Rhizomicrobium sp.]
MNTISHQAALIYVMVLVAASDGAISDRELKTIGDLSKTLPSFRDFDHSKVLPIAQDCGAILQEPEGLDAVLGLVKAALPEHLRETAYWLALEVALSDSRVMLEEIRVIDAIRRALAVDRLVAAALERGARARYQVA